MKNYWKYSLILLVLSIAVDYYIAKQLSDNDSQALDIFLLILFVPLFFSFKSALVRIFLWGLMGKRNTVETIFAELFSGDWPTPDEYDIENPEDYLTLVTSNEVNDIDIRLRASNILGAVAALYVNQQLLSRLFWSSAFKAALNKLHKSRETHI